MTIDPKIIAEPHDEVTVCVVVRINGRPVIEQPVGTGWKPPRQTMLLGLSAVVPVNVLDRLGDSQQEFKLG